MIGQIPPHQATDSDPNAPPSIGSGPYAFTPESTSNSDFTGRNPGAAGLKNLAPLEYAMLVHQYDLYSKLQPQLASAIQEAVQHLQNPETANAALRAGLISHVPGQAATQAAGLQAYGASPAAAQGAYLASSNAANNMSNAAEAQSASPAGNMARLQALSGIIGSAAPNISNLMNMSGNAGQAGSQSGSGFWGGLLSSVGGMIPGLGGKVAGAVGGGLNGSTGGTNVGGGVSSVGAGVGGI